jgi:hypothetical protein
LFPRRSRRTEHASRPSGRTSGVRACDGGPVNPDDDKLDYLVTDPDRCRTGTFRATRRPDGRWNTGLLTTEDSDGGFRLCAGDVLETRVRLPTQVGAWSAIWT